MSSSRKSALLATSGGIVILALLPMLPRVVAKGGTPNRVDPTNEPRLAFQETSFDFGEVYEGERVVHHFQFRSVGTQKVVLDPIVVNVAKASCSLPNALTVTVPGFADSDTVAAQPGTSNDVIATLDTEGYARTDFDGRFSQSIRIFSNDPSAPRTVLHLAGRIRPIVVRDPVEISMGAVFKARGQLPRYLPPVRLIPAPGVSVEFTKVTSTSRFLHPTVAPSPDGTAYVVTTAIDPSIPVGALEDVKLKVSTNHPKRPEIIIPVSGQVYPEQQISASSEYADFGFAPPGASLSKTIQMTKPGGPRWRIVGMKSNLKGGVVRSVLTRTSLGYELKVDVQAPPEPWKDFVGEVVLTTNTKLQPKLIVPVFGWTYADPWAQTPERLKAFVSDVLASRLLFDPQEVITKVLAGGKDRRVAPLLIAIAREKGNTQGRVRAIDLLEQHNLPPTIEALEAIIRATGDDELVRDEAMEVHFRMSPMRAFPLLLAGLEDPSEWVRERAATLLGELGDERAREPLLKATRDKKPDVALAAVEALEQFFDPSARPRKTSATAASQR